VTSPQGELIDHEMLNSAYDSASVARVVESIACAPPTHDQESGKNKDTPEAKVGSENAPGIEPLYEFPSFYAMESLC
jgi:hypothetical protein